MAWEVFGQVATNLATSWDLLLIIIFNVGTFVFFAKDYKIGVVLSFFINGLLSLWFYNDGMNWSITLVLMIISFVVMSLTFYISAQTEKIGRGLT